MIKDAVVILLLKRQVNGNNILVSTHHKLKSDVLDKFKFSIISLLNLLLYLFVAFLKRRQELSIQSMLANFFLNPSLLC